MSVSTKRRNGWRQLELTLDKRSISGLWRMGRISKGKGGIRHRTARGKSELRKLEVRQRNNVLFILTETERQKNNRHRGKKITNAIMSSRASLELSEQR